MALRYADDDDSDDRDDFDASADDSTDDSVDSADEEDNRCPYCSKPVYHDIEQCPHCGHYVSDEDAQRPHQAMVPKWVWYTALALLILTGLGILLRGF